MEGTHPIPHGLRPYPLDSKAQYSA